VQTHPGTIYRFGPFEVNAASGELLKNGRRIKLQEQPYRILIALLENPGEVVTREELRSRLWPDDTFVDFDGSLRVAVRKLREVLSDDADDPRYIETVPKRGYRFLVPGRGYQPIGSLQSGDTAQVSLVEGATARSDPPSKAALKPWWLLLFAACLFVFAIGWRFRGALVTPPAWKLSRLTADAGFSDAPAISRDGKLLAYSSDSSMPGERDLYVKQISGGPPIRLTFDGKGNTTPDFSRDGSNIVFRSNRDGGGIYEIPAFGGEMRLLARHGLNPRFSPDGSQVAYWIGGPNVAAGVPGSGAVWVVSAAGGEPQRIGSKFTNARYPIWSPDGKYLLLIGYTSDKVYDKSALDWWLVPTDGGNPIRTGVYDALVRTGVQYDLISTFSDTYLSVPVPSCWLAGTNSVIFSIQNGDTGNLWETSLSPRTGRVSGVFKRLTAGAGNDVDPSCASGDILAFTNMEVVTDVWALPFDLDRGIPRGTLERITEGPAKREHASLSGDGRYVAVASTQSGPLNIWVRDLETGRESHLANSSLGQRFPIISTSGSKIAFSAFDHGHRSVYISAPGGVPQKMCEGCLRATDWSRDEKTLLIFGRSPYQIDTLDIASREQTPVLKHAFYNVLYGHFSPDNRWVSFTARTQPNRSIIAIAPLDGTKPIPESAWIKIAEEGPEDWANWSPDGKTLYYTSARDGHTCLWGQRIDTSSHRPMGEAFAVQHFHGRALYEQGGWSAAGGRIAVVLVDGTNNIWMMSRSTAH
jgi:eukaryotic-like serine/threonine-protein kinase